MFGEIIDVPLFIEILERNLLPFLKERLYIEGEDQVAPSFHPRSKDTNKEDTYWTQSEHNMPCPSVFSKWL